jgi:hypothetical protein
MKMGNIKEISQSAMVIFLMFTLLSVFIPLNGISIVEANDESWLLGWSYRKSHIINPSLSAGTNYQVKIKAFYSEPKIEEIVPSGEVVSTLPVPSGTSIMSAQSAVYWDGAYLHVWYGATTGEAIGDDIYYTKTSDFINWATPVKVIDRTDGIRDPTVFVEGDYIYLFCQCFDGTNYRPIRLYKIAKTADFTNSANYVYVGVVVDVGSSGQFDDLWVASPCVVKIGSTYWLAYEAKSSSGIFTIGRAYTTNIEGSWIKDGQMKDAQGNVIYNPYGQSKDIVPDTFSDLSTLFIHLKDNAGIWHVRYMKGDIPNNSMTLSTDCQPVDGYSNHNNFAHIGFINGMYRFLMQSWDTIAYLRCYKVEQKDFVLLNQHCRTDFGDIRFTDDDGTTLLDYWMETKVDGEYAVFWVEVADDLGGNPATIYIYYGKADVTTASNGDNTFSFFDDFLGSSINPDKWYTNGAPAVSNGVLTLKGRGSDEASDQIRSKTSFAQGKFSACSRFKLNSGDGGGLFWGNDNFAWDDGDGGIGAGTQSSNFFVDKYAGGGRRQTSLVRDTSYHVFELLAYSTTVIRGWIDKLYQTTSGAGGVQSNYYVLLRAWTYATNGIVDFDWIFVRKYVDPEPSHGAWGSEEQAGIPLEHVIINEALASDCRADVGSLQTVTFHARWSNGSDVVNGRIYINGTECVTNNTGWIRFTVTSSSIGRQEWVVTSVDCDGVTDYSQIVSNPSIIWDQIQITSGGTAKESIMLDETVTIWFQAKYQYDDTIFDNTNGILYVNDLPMSWSATNSRWEYQHTPTTPGTKTFTISSIQDNLYGLTIINDRAGAQTINVWSTPFLIVSNSTITELAFNSTAKIITFNVTGPDGATGYLNITIAKTLIDNIANLTIYLDENQIEYTATSTEYAWLIHFTYHHSTHKGVILLGSLNINAVSEFPIKATVDFSIILITLIAVALVIHKKLHGKTFSPFTISSYSELRDKLFFKFQKWRSHMKNFSKK